MKDQQTIDTIHKTIQALCTERQLELIDFKIVPVSKTIALRCIVDYPQGGVTIDTCSGLNKAIGDYLQTISFADDNYTIEVNSPGLDRPLHTERDFTRIIGKNVSIFFSQPFDGKRSIDGKLINVTNESITVQTKKETITVPLTVVHMGKEKIDI